MRSHKSTRERGGARGAHPGAMEGRQRPPLLDRFPEGVEEESRGPREHDLPHSAYREGVVPPQAGRDLSVAESRKRLAGGLPCRENGQE